MNKEEFNLLLKKANFTKKEFANQFNISVGTVNNWGNTDKPFPYWVKSWLKNYIKSKSYEDVKDKVFEIEGVKSEGKG